MLLSLNSKPLMIEEKFQVSLCLEKNGILQVTKLEGEPAGVNPRSWYGCQT